LAGKPRQLYPEFLKAQSIKNLEILIHDLPGVLLDTLMARRQSTVQGQMESTDILKDMHKAIKLNKFSGKTMDFCDFETVLDSHFESGTWVESNKITLTKSLLTDRAQKWYSTHLKRRGSFNSYKDLNAEIKKPFNDPKQHLTAT
jgi:hypothetical protein